MMDLALAVVISAVRTILRRQAAVAPSAAC